MRSILSLILLLCACSDSSDVLEQLPNSSIAGAPRDEMPETRLEARIKRAVTIGEDGPRLDACGAMGQVVRVGPSGLAMRAAPFAEAEETGRLAEGARAHVCTRSLDQKWLGIVVPPAADANAAGGGGIDCGVSSPVERKQPYDGPCMSGWVSSASIRLVAG
ncbi:hypothetical protein L288_11410 [Sphingobium quisquiliarum P25]|uniref:Integron n=1 Tax=Sphingobium quisquiliarum P25 TaxID=1329909 RepID=T0I8W6_9SPHN|nr:MULTISPECIES: hypothetical protein [Sphingobium]EQB06064.1 hypothetical protein L288_11410 [Sphingobium quisquiliarum P25]